MALTDMLASLFAPTLSSTPAPVTLTPPAAVKPAVLPTRPRITPAPPKNPNTDVNGPTADGTNPGNTGGPMRSGSGTIGKLGGYLSDVAGGINNVPLNSDAISAFAYGFAGAIKSGDERRLADKNAKTAAEDRQNAIDQQQFNNDLSLKQLRANDLADAKGNLTPLGRAQVDKDVATYATENGLNGKTASDQAGALQVAKAAGFASVQAMLDDYRKQREEEIKGDYGVDVLAGKSDQRYPPNVQTAPGYKGSVPRPRPGEEPTAPQAPQEASSDPYWDVQSRTWKVDLTSGGTGTWNAQKNRWDGVNGVGDAVNAAGDVAANVGGAIGGAATRVAGALGGGSTPTAVAKPGPTPGQPVQSNVGAKGDALKPSAKVAGSGSKDDPFTGFTDDPQGIALFQQTVPVGAYYAVTDANGKTVVLRRTK